MCEYRWRKADESLTLAHCPNHETKNIYFARIYTIGQGYEFSETNNQIINLKHPVDSGRGPLRYKNLAIEKFAEELSGFFSLFPDRQFLAVSMPPSKTRDHPLFDDRLEQVVKQVAQSCNNVEAALLLEGVMDVEPYHSGVGRSAQGCYDAMEIDSDQRQQFGDSTDRVIAVIDDVLTSGAHYEATRQHLEREFSSDIICGVFWAKAEPI